MSLPTSLEAQSPHSLDCVTPCRQLTFSEIQVATQNFDESLVIGHGGFGKVYRGVVSNGENFLDVAIKRLESTSDQGADEFWAEVEMLSKLRHCNLVSLIGYCNDRNEMILVYEYMPNKTLSYHLHENRLKLTWAQRLKIAVGAARGLEYLHTGTGIRQGVVHRDVKSSNVLLDDTWASKISDFGLSRIVPTNQPITYVNTVVKGTFGYLDPNYFHTSRLTRKSDVYAFGVILFELLCGRKALNISLDEEEMGLATWAQDSIKEGRLKQIVDWNLREVISPKTMKEFGVLANRCLDNNPKKRPTMAEVVAGLESILALQEKTNRTLVSLYKKIFGIKVPTFHLPSSHEKSVEITSLKSMESYLHKVGVENQIFRRFDFKTINDATENFSLSNMIGGTISLLHKGKLQNGQNIAIAGPYSHKQCDWCINTVSILVKVEHHNLAHLLGWCIEGTSMYLVYDNPDNYSILKHRLYDRNSAPLDWNQRCKILLSVAHVLLYLHKHAPVRAICCDVNIGNILVDNHLEPKLYDLCHAVSTTINETDYIQMDAIRGTSGYVSPEYLKRGRLSAKADVFCFGMTVLETIAGPSMTYRMHGSNQMFCDDIWRNWVNGTCSNLIDSRISVDPRSITRFIHIGLWCIQNKASDRPTMEEVVTVLLGNSSISLPTLNAPTFVLERYWDSHGSLWLDLSDSDINNES